MSTLTKRLGAAFLLGAITPLLGALWLGGENLAQAGLRLAAVERGFSEATKHHSWVASVDADALPQAEIGVPVVEARAPRKVSRR